MIQEIFAAAGFDEKPNNRSFRTRAINAALLQGVVLKVARKGLVFTSEKPLANGKFVHGYFVLPGGFKTRFRFTTERSRAEEIFDLLGRKITEHKGSFPVSIDAPTCSKCGGRGNIPAFSHICNGVCFDCLGLGFKSNAMTGKIKNKKIQVA
jgi:hypothetical protein